MTSADDERPIRRDRAMIAFALCFCFWGVAEFLFPPTGEEFDRTIPKLAHVAIMATCLFCTALDFRHSTRKIRFRGPLIYGAILSLILMIFPVFTFDRMSDTLGPFLWQKFYAGCYTIEWYAVFLFCSVHVQVNPRAYQTFLKFIPLIFLFFFLAGHRLTNMNVRSLASEELQAGVYAGYYLVCLFPFIWDLPNRTIKFALLLLLIYGVVYSMKRGAILCLVSSLFLSFLTYYLFFAEGAKRIPYFFGLSVLFAVMVAALAYSVSTKKDTFEHRMQDIQTGSGRVDLYKKSWNTFKSLPLDEKLTGTRTPSKQIRAHNDFLFVLNCYGIAGCVFYVLFDIGLLFTCLRAIVSRFPLLPSLMAALGNIAVIEMVSYGIEGHAFVICCAYVGFVQGYFTAEPEELSEYNDLEQYENFAIPEGVPFADGIYPEPIDDAEEYPDDETIPLDS